MTVSPETTNLDLMTRYTRNFGNGWQGNVQGSVLSSEAREVGLYNNAFSTGVSAKAA
jgi:hypothetical protein